MGEKPESGMSWQAVGFIVSLIFMITAVVVDIEVGYEWRMRGSARPGFGIRDVLTIAAYLAFGFFAFRYFVYRRKLRAPGAEEVLVEDARPPVLYLRSFLDDPKTAKVLIASTEEERLAMVMNEIGPFVAIGRPGEEMPELGAARMYVGDDEWQSTIAELMAKARLVVLRIGETDGFWWEVERAARQVRPERLLFLVPRDQNLYEDFRRRAVAFMPVALPEYESSRGAFGSLNGLLYFEPNWTPHFVKIPLAFQSSLFRAKFKDAQVPALKGALRPVFEQLGAEWNAPPIRLSMLLLFGFFLALVLFATASAFC